MFLMTGQEAESVEIFCWFEALHNAEMALTDNDECEAGSQSLKENVPHLIGFSLPQGQFPDSPN